MFFYGGVSVMTTPRQRLLVATGSLKRKLYASLPLHYRVARLFMVLGSDSTLVFARALYAIFLLAKVEGLPPVDPASPLGKAIERGDKNLARLMPANYAASEIVHFKNKILRVLTKFNKNPALMQDVLSTAFENLIKENRWKSIDPSQGLQKAEAFVLRVISNASVDMHRSRRRQEENTDSLTFEDEDGSSVMDDVPDMDAADVGHMMDLKMVMELLEDPEVISDLSEVHPDAPLFIKLLLDGYTQKDILGNPPKGEPSMLPHWDKTPAAWQPKPDRGYMTNILRVLRNHALDQESRQPGMF